MYTEKDIIKYCGSMLNEATGKRKRKNLNWFKACKEMETGKYVSLPKWHLEKTKKQGSKIITKKFDTWLFMNDQKNVCVYKRLRTQTEDKTGKKIYEQTSEQSKDLIKLFKQDRNLENYKEYFNPFTIWSTDYVSEEVEVIPDNEFEKQMNK